MQNIMNQLPGFFIKLVLAAFGLLFALCLLFTALVMLVVGLVRWALTGKKPAPFVAFQQFRQFRAGRFPPFSMQAKSRHSGVDVGVGNGVVVDVEAREVPGDQAQKNMANDAKPLP